MIWERGIRMSNRKILSILCLFLLVLTSFRMIWISLSVIPTQIEAEQGVLDLREWDFDKNHRLNLDGEWEFYPNVFLTSDEIAAYEKTVSLRPGKWNEDTPIHGTYRLRILMADERSTRHYQLLLSHNPYVEKVIVNDEVVIDNESADYGVTKRKSGFLSRSTVVKAAENHEIEILIHQPTDSLVKTKGIVKSIQFGDESTLKRWHFTSISMQILAATFTLIHFVFGIILYLWRRKQKFFLYFGLAAFFKTIAILLEDDCLLLVWLPLDYVWATKLLSIAYIGSVAFILLFIQSFFAEHKNNKVIQIFNWLYSSLVILVILLPLTYISSIIPFIFITAIFSYTQIGFLMWGTIKKGNIDNVILLLAAASTISSFLWPFYKNNSFTELPYYPVDAILAFLSISILLFKRFFKTSDQNKEFAIKLQQEVKRKDNFLANTSHELRNPLHGMINTVQSVLQNEAGQLTEKSEKSIELAVTIGRHMSRTLDDLLDVTRLKEHRIQLRKERLDIHAVISGVVDMLGFMADNKEIQLALQLPTDLPKVLADKNRLIQILFNLLHNAMKFSNDGTITIYADIRDGMMHIHIKDTGMGIDETTLQHIFEPYEQGNSGMTAIVGGLGLGLSICRQLVELHGGELTVQSVVGEGSQFTFTLPLADEFDENQTVDQVEFSMEESEKFRDVALSVEYPFVSNRLQMIEGAYKPKILAVDDDPINLQVLSNILSSEQYELETVTSGKMALEHLDRVDWDLIITDVMMPHMSGYELTRLIREKYSISELPILLITARSQPEDIYTGFLAGANDYVTKPVDALELNVRVHALTDLKDSVSERLRMEAAWLQAQIEPHFLFNTLNTITSLSLIDDDRMATLLEVFGNYLEKSFDPKNLERVVPLTHERELLDAYLYIEQERFGNRLQVVWEVEAAGDVYIPPLSIQTLVENAVKHGVLKRVEGGIVRIHIYSEDDHIKITIQDNGVGMDTKKIEQVLKVLPDKKRGIGLLNTNQRLKRLYGEGLHIESTPGQGTSVSFKVPKSQKQTK